MPVEGTAARTNPASAQCAGVVHDPGTLLAEAYHQLPNLLAALGAATRQSLRA